MSNQNDKLPIERISQTYAKLFPSQFEFLVLYNLHINYAGSEILYAEIKQAIQDTSRLPMIDTGKDRQAERTFKSLLRSFMERVPLKSNRFILTPHAEKIIEIVTQRINNPYLSFPLKQTFEQYFTLPADAGDNIEALQNWFRFGFLNNARQAVTGHLEALKLSVDDAIVSLNEVLEADNLSAIQLLEQFAANFQVLGDKARQIAEAIRMKVDVYYTLRDIVDSFGNNPEEQGNWQIARQIQEDVVVFFEKVDGQLDLINTKIGFAGTKITELQETLRTQSQYKIALRKVLLYMLENSRYDQLSGITLPENFPAKGLVQEKFRLRYIRRYDFGFLRKVAPVTQDEDQAYEEENRRHIEGEMGKQARIQVHVERLQDQLKRTKKIGLSDELFKIIEQDPDGLEIGVQTGYELLRDLSGDHSLDIENTLQSIADNTFHIWKTTIKQPDSHS